LHDLARFGGVSGNFRRRWRGRAMAGVRHKMAELSPEGDPFKQFEEFLAEKDHVRGAVECQIHGDAAKDQQRQNNGYRIGHLGPILQERTAQI
jgi:hypothetical protein